jgi:DNA-binding transcriptional MocR family regulator
MIHVICAASVRGAGGRTSCKRQASGSNPLTGSRSEGVRISRSPRPPRPGDELPSITELSALQGIGTGVIRHALEALTADGLILARRGQTSIVAGNAGSTLPGGRKRPGPGHDCRNSGCRPHVCQPMKASTIRGIHSILSGAFAAAQRWEWTDRNPAESARPPTTIRRPIPATSPEDVANVITEARARSTALGLYLWLVAITGVRRGELCGPQIRDIDLDRGLNPMG